MRVPFVMYLMLFILIASCSTMKQRKENVESFKEMAFCHCLSSNYSRIDSSFTSTYMDLSLSVIFSGRPLSRVVADSVRVYSRGETYGANSMASHTTDQVGGNSNFISLSCLEFYKSKELEVYIKKLMKEDR